MSAEELAAQLDRLVDRLRSMSLSRLEGAYEPETTRVVAASELAQRLADAAAALERPVEPVWRDVPEVPSAAVGDLVAVTGGDVLAAVDGAPAQVPTRDGGRVATARLTDALARDVRALRVRL